MFDATEEELEMYKALARDVSIAQDYEAAEQLLERGEDPDGWCVSREANRAAKARRLQAHILAEEVNRGVLNKVTAIEAAGSAEPTNEQLAERMLHWAQTMTSEGRSGLVDHLRMSVPADPARDFDLVMALAARRLLEKEG